MVVLCILLYLSLARCTTRGQFLPHRTFQPCCCPPIPFGLRLGCALTTVVPVVSRSRDCDMRGATAHLLDRFSSTTLLVSARAKGLDLVGLNEPEDEILEEPEQHLAMDVRQRATRD